MASDYQRISRAIQYIREHHRHQPSLEEIAAHLHLSPYHFQRLFSRWVGVTPKRYLQILTVEHAKRLLEQSRPLLEVSEDVGLSSSSRLYDHFVQLEAVTPGEYKQGGRGLEIHHAVHDSPFGEVFIANTAKGICKLEFLEGKEDAAPLETLQQQWPNAGFQEERQHTAALVDDIFSQSKPTRPLSLHVRGTNFQVNVWKALLQIGSGDISSYRRIARAVGSPNAARAVGSAIGANPVAYLIPCHRVIREDGRLGGYRWNENRKHAMLLWENIQKETEDQPNHQAPASGTA